MDALVQQHILLVPFTVDHLGALGPLAKRFLYGDTPPDYLKPPKFTFESAKQAHDLAHGPAGLDGIVPTANTKWKHRTTTWFAPTYHTILPGQWATKTLGLNIITHLADHFFDATATIQNKPVNKSTTRKKKSFRSQRIYHHSRKKLLTAQPTSRFSRTYGDK